MNSETELYLYKIDDSETAAIPLPCDPDEKYPEYRLSRISSKKNYIYRAIRELFHALGYDREHYDMPEWNPLGAEISPGNTVLIKPNMVLHKNYARGQDHHSVVTHPAIIRAIVDYVYIALQGRGRIIIGDAPINSARFDLVCENMGITRLRSLYRSKGFKIEVEDFRLYTMDKDEHGVIRNRRSLKHDVRHKVVRFCDDSMLAGYDAAYRRYRVTEYEGQGMLLHHQAHLHEYCIHDSVFDADVIISLPKIKTHHKAGYTCAMKNFVGVNGSKDWLPHHRKGSPATGGDEYQHRSLRKAAVSGLWDIRWKIRNPRVQLMFRTVERFLRGSHRIVPFKDLFWEGSWWGNQTISRTVNDLNRAVLYGDRTGTLRDVRQRKLLYLVDGIICGEGEGPMGATAKRCNMLIWGSNAFAVDLLVVRLMGFDAAKIDTLRVCRGITKYPIFECPDESIVIHSNLSPESQQLSSVRKILAYCFIPSQGWKGHIELEEQ